MNPEAIRNANWGEIQAWVSGARRKVYEALRGLGPSTTQALANAMGMNLLTVRPRVTELVQVGLVELYDKDGHEGVYVAVNESAAELAHQRRRQVDATGKPAQLEMFT